MLSWRRLRRGYDRHLTDAGRALVWLCGISMLLGVNTFSFPSGGSTEETGDKYRGQRWYARDGLNLVEEAGAQLKQLHMGTLDEYEPGAATAAARISVGAERLRLLYVGITRARRELILTYNTGRNPDRDPHQPAMALLALNDYLQSRRKS